MKTIKLGGQRYRVYVEKYPWSCQVCNAKGINNRLFLSFYLDNNTSWDSLWCINHNRCVGRGGDLEDQIKEYLKRSHLTIKSFYNKYKNKMEVVE